MSETTAVIRPDRAIDPTVDLRELDFCVVDTETTGGKASLNRIIDIAVFRFRDGVVIKKFQSLINPGRPIPPWITLLTGIDDGMVRSAPSFADIVEPLRDIFTGGVFVAHNVPFDRGFIEEEFRREGREFGMPHLCTLRMARLLMPDLPSRSLGFLCDHLLINVWDRHRAYGDAEATVYVLKHFLKSLKQDQGIGTWGELAAFMECGPLKLPAAISPAQFLALPSRPGLYALRNSAGDILAEGKTKDLRRRIRSYFSRENQSEKSERLRETVAFLETKELPFAEGWR